MRLEFYPPARLTRQIREITGRYLDLQKYKIFFFGSRVTNKGDEYSDIDVGIEGPEEISYKIMATIKEDIEKLSILYKIEIVDFKKVSEDFRKVAYNALELIR